MEQVIRIIVAQRRNPELIDDPDAAESSSFTAVYLNRDRFSKRNQMRDSKIREE